MPRMRFLLVLFGTLLVAASCSSGDDDSAKTTPAAEADSVGEIQLPQGEVQVEFLGAELVWALDGEPVGAAFSYDEPIARDRFDAGIVLEARFGSAAEPTGVDLSGFSQQVFINNEHMGANRVFALSGGAGAGPEGAWLRMNSEAVTVARDTGFTLRVDVARPLSPITLGDEIRRAESLGLDPSLDYLDVFDLPPVLTETSLMYRYGFDGALVVLFSNSQTEVEVEFEVVLDVAESIDNEVNYPNECVELSSQYLDIANVSLANAEDFLLSRERVLIRVRRTASDLDCSYGDFERPMCDALQVINAESPIPANIVGRHSGLCPNITEPISALAVDSTLVDGLFQMKILPPLFGDGGPALLAVASLPAWADEDGFAVGDSTSFDVRHPEEATIRITVSSPGVSLTYFDDYLAESTTPSLEGADFSELDEVMVAGRPALRRVEGSGLETDRPEFRALTVVDLEDRALEIGLTVALFGGHIQEAEARELFQCIESSIVVELFVEGEAPPMPAADCTGLGAFAPIDDEPDPTTTTTELAPSGDPAVDFDGRFITVDVPGRFGLPAHVVRVAAPGWELDRTTETDLTQRLTLSGPEPETSFLVRVTWVGDRYADKEDDAVAPSRNYDDPSEFWSVERDETFSLAGREARLVVTSGTYISRNQGRIAKILLPVDDERLLEIKVGVDLGADIETEIARIVDSLTIETK